MEIQLWRELLDPYQLAVDELTVKFHHIIEEHRNQGLYSPIESVDGRVKSIVSILDKMQRKNVSMNDIEKKIEDLAGIRIIMSVCRGHRQSGESYKEPDRYEGKV